MLKESLNTTTNGGGEEEDIAELVVTALGTSGTHYMCWKNTSGEYKQRSYGLPAQLHEWLFPTDGKTRDFQSLQVILLSDDGFYASDKNGEIRNDSPLPIKQLRRASTIYDANANQPALVRRSTTFNDGNQSAVTTTSQRRLSRGREYYEQNSERPRSSTLPATLPRENTITGKELKPLFSHSRTPSVDKPRLSLLVPVAVRAKRLSQSRPRSIDTTFYQRELEVLKEQPTPKPNATFSPRDNAPSDPGRTPRQVQNNMRQARRSPVVRSPAARSPILPIIPTKSRYVDSSMQTDPEPAPEPEVRYIEPPECSCRSHGYSSVRDSAVSFGMSSVASMSGYDTPITKPDFECYDEEDWDCPPPHQEPPCHPQVMANPIIMGRMADYFRSTTYTLGASLQPPGYG
ncbi:hypothetical protein F4808DRAFT_444939 [Astrocystis sublimbata]|nr:hypothetical protein F4808DRAFT_444939 [Astrocystis sublimbata]